MKLPERPERFSTAVKAELMHTWSTDVTLRTGLQVMKFSDEFVSRKKGITIHEFEFEFGGVRYEFSPLGE